MVLDHRLTQEPVEAAEQATDPNRRLTQEVVEVAYQQLLYRLTQEPVEAAEQVTGSDLLRRFTQIAVEVAITFPVHPWADQPFPEHPPWSPAYIQDPIESKEQAYQSYYGIHNKEIHIGERRIWSKFLRR